MREVPGSIACQGPRHTKDVIRMVPVVPLFSTEHSQSLSAIENPSKSEVIGRCGGDVKTNDHAEPTKVEL